MGKKGRVKELILRHRSALGQSWSVAAGVRGCVRRWVLRPAPPRSPVEETTRLHLKPIAALTHDDQRKQCYINRKDTDQLRQRKPQLPCYINHRDTVKLR